MAEEKEAREKHEKGKQEHNKEKPEAKAQAPPQKRKELVSITRIAGRDLRGDLPLSRAISSIKGIGPSLGSILSKILSHDLSLDPKKPIGEFPDEDIKKIEEAIQNPGRFKIPKFLYNRQKDRTTGEDMHLIGNDLVFATKQDIQHQVDLYTWVGYRHAYGQKVRGQRTRTTGRSGMAVGVLRKSVLAKAGAAAQAGAQGAPGAPGAPAAAGPAAPGAKGAPAGPAPKGGAPAAGPAAGAKAPAAKKEEAKK